MKALIERLRKSVARNYKGVEFVVLMIIAALAFMFLTGVFLFILGVGWLGMGHAFAFMFNAIVKPEVTMDFVTGMFSVVLVVTALKAFSPTTNIQKCEEKEDND